MTRSGSTVTADSAVVALHPEPPYLLRDASGRAALLAEWTQLLTTVAAPIQIWHGPRPVVAAAGCTGDGAAAGLVRSLAEGAHARQTLMLTAGNGEAAPAWPAVTGE